MKDYRRTLDHPLLQDFDAEGLWSRLRKMAAYQDTSVRLRGGLFMLRRGQLALSVSAFAEQGGMSRKRIRLLLDRFEADGMITISRAPGKVFSIITICN
ncbi:hypothetical protein [Geminicoccus flavidas]|uniref:hypothetical protein n=1 Tax=Geminicoccus flavidas TaxID=2506407 RepID=UPI001357DC6F|nr:hypothetical protein [Geminicoccus flavidas]